VERGDVSGCSFGFQTLKDAWKQEGQTLVRALQDIDL
jgi:phage head maturation protease